jgi:hypothetical protein
MPPLFSSSRNRYSPPSIPAHPDCSNRNHTGHSNLLRLWLAKRFMFGRRTCRRSYPLPTEQAHFIGISHLAAHWHETKPQNIQLIGCVRYCNQRAAFITARALDRTCNPSCPVKTRARLVSPGIVWHRETTGKHLSSGSDTGRCHTVN